MIRIAITIEAFEAIAQTLPLCSVGYEVEANERGERTVRLDLPVVNRLTAMRRQSYSDVIAAGERVTDIARSYNVSHSTISRLAT
jgi:hypothetical protein